jgi:hypothetical protein
MGSEQDKRELQSLYAQARAKDPSLSQARIARELTARAKANGGKTWTTTRVNSLLGGGERAKRTQRVDTDDMAALRAYLRSQVGVAEPLDSGLVNRATDWGVLAVSGRLTEEEWFATKAARPGPQPRKVGVLLRSDYPIESQKAYEVVGTPLPGSDLQVGDIVITAPIPPDYQPQPDDKLVCFVEHVGLFALSLRRAIRARGGKIELRPMLEQPRQTTHGGQLVGLVIGLHRDLRKKNGQG